MAEVLRFDVVTNAHTEGLEKAALELKELRGESDKTNESFRKMGDNSKTVQRDIKSHADAVRVLREEYKQTQTKIRELNIDLLRGGGSESIIRRQLRTERSALRDLTRAGTEIGVTLGTSMADGAGKTFLSSLQGGLSTPGAGPALAGAIGGLVTAAAPGLGALIGGALTGALGTGAMAAGILTAAHDSQVKAAAKQFGEDISAEFFQGQAFVRPIIAGLDVLKEGFRDLDINSLLAPLAPTVITIAHGVADFVNNLKDAGLSKSLERMPEFAHIAAEGLASMGSALGFFVDEVSSSEGAMDGLRAFFALINGTVRITALGINFLEGVFHGFSTTLAHVAILANKISFGHLDQFQHAAESILGIAPEVSGQLVQMSTATNMLNHGLDPFGAYLKEASENAKELKYSLSALFGVQMSLDEATLHWKEGLLALQKELANGKFNLDSTTESGLRHQQMVLDAVQSAQQLADATYAQNHSQQAANQTYQTATEELRKFLEKAGLSKAAIDKLIGNYAITVTTTFRTQGSRPSFNLGNLSGPAADLFRAGGGPVKAGQGYVVGENRAEWFVPKSNGYVFPDVPSGGMSGSNARPLVINLQGASHEEAAMIEKIRTAVAARGGTLAVLGLRG